LNRVKTTRNRILIKVFFTVIEQFQNVYKPSNESKLPVIRYADLMPETSIKGNISAAYMLLIAVLRAFLLNPLVSLPNIVLKA